MDIEMFEQPREPMVPLITHTPHLSFGMPITNYTDEELIAIVSTRDSTPLEADLARRLGVALDYINYVREQGEDEDMGKVWGH